MIYGILIGIIIGAAAASACCWQRIRELQRALKTSNEMVNLLCARDTRYQCAITNIRARVGELRQILNPGGKATLPVAAGSAGQHVNVHPLIRTTARISGGASTGPRLPAAPVL